MSAPDELKTAEATVQAEEANRLRIVSLLPSITEILASLGLSDSLVGITHECDFPPEAIAGARVVTRSDISPYAMSQGEINEAVVGALLDGHSLYALEAEILKELRPDLIFTQALCDICAVSYPVVLDTCARVMGGQAMHLGKIADETSGAQDGPDPRIISLEPEDLGQVLKTIRVAGEAVGPEALALAENVIEGLEAGFRRIREVTSAQRRRPKAVFMEWQDPIFNGGHWIPEMMDIAGATYEMCEKGDRSRTVPLDEFLLFDPDVILIGPCGFNLERSSKDAMDLYKHDWWCNMRAVKEGRVFALDGNSYFARPGPRLLQGCAIIAACVHGESVTAELGPELVPSGSFQRITPSAQVADVQQNVSH